MKANSRIVALNDWLHKHNAKALWSVRVPRIGVVEAWSVKGNIVVTMLYNGDNGWDMWVPACSDSIDTDKTLHEAERVLKLV